MISISSDIKRNYVRKGISGCLLDLLVVNESAVPCVSKKIENSTKKVRLGENMRGQKSAKLGCAVLEGKLDGKRVKKSWD